MNVTGTPTLTGRWWKERGVAWIKTRSWRVGLLRCACSWGQACWQALLPSDERSCDVEQKPQIRVRVASVNAHPDRGSFRFRRRRDASMLGFNGSNVEIAPDARNELLSLLYAHPDRCSCASMLPSWKVPNHL